MNYHTWEFLPSTGMYLSHLGTGLRVPSQYKSVLALAPIHEQTFPLLYYCTIWDLPSAASATHTVRLKTQKFPVKGLQQRLCAVWGCTVMARNNLYGALQQHVGGWEMEDLTIMRKRKWLFVGVRERKYLINTGTYILLELIPGHVIKLWHDCVAKTSDIIMSLLYQTRTKAQRETWTRNLSTRCSASPLASSIMAGLFSATSPEMLLIYAGRKFAGDYFLPWSTHPVSLSTVMNKNCSYTCTARFIPTYGT